MKENSFLLAISPCWVFLSPVSQAVIEEPELNCPSQAAEDFDKSPCRVKFYNQSYKQQCESLAKYVVKDDYQVECHYNYHHYNSSAFKYKYRKSVAKRKRSRVRIGGFNILHPVNGKTRFKDLELIAKIIDKDFDVLAGIELIPVPKDEWRSNNKIVGYIYEQKELLNDKSLSAADRREIEENIEKAKGSYLAPGYLRILNHLRELDPTWSLIISSRAESAKPADQKEFTGFYYRAEIVKPVENKFCKTERIQNKGKPYACTPWFNKEINQAFSRRPFITSFESGDFNFTLLGAHIVFSSPSKADQIAEILRPAFGISTLDHFEHGSGVTKATYARWAEVKLTLDLMEEMRKNHKMENLIYVADFNLEKGDAYWSELMKAFPGGEVFVDSKTSIDQDGGYSSNYDHFIFDPAETTECVKNGKVDAERIDFFTTKHIKDYLEDNYHPGNGEWILDRFMSRFDGKYEAYGRVGSLKIRPMRVDKTKIKKRMESQVTDPSNSVYNLNIKIVSDHVPVKMTCAIK